MLDQLIIFCAQYLPFVIFVIAFWYVLKLENIKRKSALILFGVSSVVALIVDKILNHFISSARPFVVKGIAPLFYHTTDNGFPSEHTLFAVLIASVIFVYNRKLGLILGILSLIVGIARVVADVHHPVDIFGGIVIGTGAVLVSRYIISCLKHQNIVSFEVEK